MGYQTTLPPKKDVARGLLLRGTVFVHLDPRGDGVVVPPWLREQAQLVLQVGLDMPIPIVDLRVDDEGLFGTLSFNRSPFTCVVPWSAVFAVVGEDGRGMVWPGSLPPEIRAEVEREAGLLPAPALELVSDDDDPMESGDGEVVDLAARRRGPAAAPTERPAPAHAGADGEASRPRPQRRQRKGRALPPYLRIVK